MIAWYCYWKHTHHAPFKGKELSGIHTIWTWEDIIEINKSLMDAEKGGCYRGGLLGLEAAIIKSLKWALAYH